MPTPERFAIKSGQRVLVTAGAAGIGQAIASTFAGAGARVHICDISQGVLDECLSASPDISGTLADVSDEHDVARLFAEVDRQLSGLDVLVNNAGIAGPTGGIHEISPADWRRTIDVNLTGQFYCARLAVPMLRKASEGAIINMASGGGAPWLRLSHTVRRGQVGHHRPDRKSRQGARSRRHSRQRHSARYRRRAANDSCHPGPGRCRASRLRDNGKRVSRQGLVAADGYRTGRCGHGAFPVLAGRAKYLRPVA